MRRLFALVVGFVLAIGLLPALSSPAQALEPPNTFTSAALPTWQTGGIAWTVASAQGLTFVGGTFNTIRPPGAATGTGEITRRNFAVFDARTGNPTTCAPAFTVPAGSAEIATVRSLSVSPDKQTLYVGGFFSSAAGVTRNHLAAFDIATCTLISNFKPLPNATVRAIASTPTVVYYGGSVTQVGGVNRARAAAASAVGTATPGTLLAWDPVFSDEVRTLALKPDNSVVLAGGDFQTVNNQASHALVALDGTGGNVDFAFGSTFVPNNSVVKDIAADATGFYTGNEGSGGGVFDGRIGLNWNYTERWRDTCLGATQAVVVYNNLLYSGSHAHDCSSMGQWVDGPRWHFIAQSVSNPPTMQPWFPNTNEGLGEGIGPRDMAVAPTSSGTYLWSVGEFTTVNGQPQQGVTRFGGAPDTVAPSMPTPYVSSPQAGQVRVAWKQSLDTDDATLTYRVFRDGGSVPIYTTTAKSWHWTRRQMTFTDTGLAVGSTHTYRVSASDGTNTTLTSPRSVVVSSGPSAYAERIKYDGANTHWRFNETGDVFISDAINNNNLTFRGAATYQVTPAALTGDPSRAMTIGGTTGSLFGEDRITSPTAFSVETWIKTTTTVGGKIIGFGNKQLARSSQYDRQLYMRNDGRVSFGVYTGSTTVLTSPLPLNDGAWHLLSAAQGTGGMTLWVDGLRVGSNSISAAQSYPGYWRVGSDTLSNWPTRPTSEYWQGSLDEMAVYSSALTDFRVGKHWQAAGRTLPGATDFYGKTVSKDNPDLYWRLGETTGSITEDATYRGQTGTYANGVLRGQQPGAVSGTTDGAAGFDGSNDLVYLTGSSITPPTTFSAEAWVKTNSTSGGKILGFGSSQTGSSGTADRHLYMTDNGRVSFGVRTSNNNTAVLTSPASINNNAWHHVAGTRGPGGMALYIDGVAVATNSTTNSNNYSGYWRVGSGTLSGWTGTHSSDNLRGTIDEVAVYRSQLTAAQMATHYSAGNPSATDKAAPTPPTNVTVGLAGGDAQLTWEPALDNRAVTGYTVHRSTSETFTPTAANQVGATTGTTFTQTGMTEGTWFYEVVATDAAGNKSLPSDAQFLIVSDVTAPAAPGNPSVVSTTASSAEISWPASSSADVIQYVVHRSQTSGFTPSASTEVAYVSSPDTGLLDSELAPGSYFYRVVARDAAGNVSPVTAQVQAVVVDNDPPSVPGAVTIAVTGSTATVQWDASVDSGAGGIAGYDVYRSADPAFQPSAATLLGSTTGTSLVDPAALEGTSYYRVVARDSAGNRSDPSAPQSIDVAPYPSVATLTPTADSYANAGAQSTNFGSTASMSSRGTPGAVSYLRFAMPATPAGKVLTSAVLRVRTTADSFAGSLEPHAVSVAANDWTEDGLTWLNRPAVTGGPLGSITDTVPSTTYSTSLDVFGLAGLAGEQTLAVSNTGTDNFWFWSREHATASFRPQLTLTFSPDDVAPNAPTALQTNVTGSSVGLTWSAPAGEAAVSYNVHRSTAAGFAVSDLNKIGSSMTPSFTDASRPDGTWHYRVVAIDANGNRSEASSGASALVDATAPAAPSGVTATVNGADVSLNWSAASGGATAYDVYRSADPAAVPDASTTPVGSATGTTFAESSLPQGTWYYRVVARDAAGNRGPASAAAQAVVDGAPTVPADVATNVTGSAVQVTWTASTDPSGVAAYEVYRGATAGFTPSAATLVGQPSTTTFTENGTPVGTWFYRVIARDPAGHTSDPSAAAQAVVADASLPGTPAEPSVAVSGGSVALTWPVPSGSPVGYDVYRSATAGFTPGASNLLTHVTEASYTDASRPPGDWYYRVVAVDAEGDRSAASAEAHAVVPDSDAPTAPELAAGVTGTTVALTWSAATDNVAVAGYEVHRGSSAGFAPGDLTRISSGLVTGTTFTDAARPVGTWYYRVIAADAADNRTSSNEASAEILPDVVVSTLVPTADTYANEGAKTTNFGTTSSLTSRGTLGAVSYLRFELPAAPAGKTLTSALLRFRTTTESIAGSTEEHSVYAASDAWIESGDGGLTWNNRPAVSGGPPLATIAAGTVPNTAYTAPVDVAGLQGLLGTQTSLAVTNTGTDNLWFWSRTFGNATARPQLVLTFG